MIQLDNIRLLVTQFDDCFKFYKDILGFKVTWGELGGGYASFEAGEGKIFAIFDRKEMAEAIGTSHLPLIADTQDKFALIFRVDNLEKTVERLQSHGVSLLTDIQDQPHWGIRTAHLRDPDGNLIELCVSMPKDQWEPSLRREDEKYQDR
jgi:lactoylglutathione lyase